MTPLEQRLIRRLIDDPSSMSRNRNFHTFDDPAFARARRIARHLRSIRSAVLAAGEGCVRIVRAGGAWSIRVLSPEAECVRDSFLADEEFDVLREDATVAELLDRAQDSGRSIA